MEGIVVETEVVHTAVVRIDFEGDIAVGREVTGLVVGAFAEVQEDPSVVDSWACFAVGWDRLPFPFRGSFVLVPFVPFVLAWAYRAASCRLASCQGSCLDSYRASCQDSSLAS